MPNSVDRRSQSPSAIGRILIGIPSFRRPEALRKLFASLSEQKEVDDLMVEVFVADNDPERREASLVSKAVQSTFRWPISSRLVHEPGISAARNAIIEQARVRGVAFVAMLDDDEVAAPNWLFEILKAQKQYQADVVGGPMHYLFDSDAPLGVVQCGVFVTPNLPEGILSIIKATPNILFACRRLEKNGWPEFNLHFGLTGGEDREFLERLRKLRFRFAWAPAARTFEPVSQDRLSTKFILRRSFSNGNADIRIRRSHREIAGLLISLGKAVALLATAPVGALLLLVPSRRLWILAKWFRSLGKAAALLGYGWEEYAPSRITGTST